MQLSNYHSHCLFCDGRDHPEEYVKYAITRGFRAYGFSSHAPMPFPTPWNMPEGKMDDYLAVIDGLKKKYAGQIEIYVALEIDYLGESCNAAKPYFQELPLDYRISSIHFVPDEDATELNLDTMTCIDGPYNEFEKGVNEKYNGDIQRFVKRFFDATLEMIDCGGFDIVGHIDKIYQNGAHYPGFDYNAHWYLDPMDEVLLRVNEKGLMVEINSKNMQRKRNTFPRIEHFRRLKELNIPVMVNSDAHYPEVIDSGRQETFDLLQSAGIRTTWELFNGIWTECPIP